MKTYQFFYEIDGKKVLFNLPEDKNWAEADGDPALTISVSGRRDLAESHNKLKNRGGNHDLSNKISRNYAD